MTDTTFLSDVLCIASAGDAAGDIELVTTEIVDNACTSLFVTLIPLPSFLSRPLALGSSLAAVAATVGINGISDDNNLVTCFPDGSAHWDDVAGSTNTCDDLAVTVSDGCCCPSDDENDNLAV